MHSDQGQLAHLCQVFKIDRHISKYFTEQAHKETESLEKECRETAITMWSAAAFTDVMRMHSADVPLCCRLLATLTHPTMAEPTNLLTPSRVCSAVMDALSLLRLNQDVLAAIFIEMDRRTEVSCVRHVARLVCRSFFHSMALPHYEAEFLLFIGRLLELALLPGVDPRQILFGESSAFANLLSAYIDHSPAFRAFLDSAVRVPLMSVLSSGEASFELGQTGPLAPNPIEFSSNDQQAVCRHIISSLSAARSAIPEGFVWLLHRVSSLLSGRFTDLRPTQPMMMCSELAARCLALAVADPYILNLVDEFLIASPHSITLLGQVANILQKAIIEAATASSSDQSHEMADFINAIFPTDPPQQPEFSLKTESLPLAMLLTGAELRLLIDSCRTLSAIHSEPAGRLASYVASIPLTVLPQSVTAAPSQEASASPLCALLASDVVLTFPPLVDVFAHVGLPDRNKFLAAGSSENGIDHNSQNGNTSTQASKNSNASSSAAAAQTSPNNPVNLPPALTFRWYVKRSRRAERTASTHSSGSNEERRMRPMEKRTRFMLNSNSQNAAAASAASDFLEPSEAASTQFDPSEAASTHSCVSLDNDGSLSDMSGRATPDVSGRDTPLSAAPGQDQEGNSGISAALIAPSIASSIQGSVLSSHAGFAVPNLPVRPMRPPGAGSDLRTSSAGNSSNRQQPTDDVTEKFGKFDIKPEILAASGKAPSDSWSTEVMASEIEWNCSEPGGEDSSRWSVEPEADDAPSVSEIEHDQTLSSALGGATSSSFAGAAVADDIDDEEMMMMVAAAEANRLETSGSADWGEPPAVPENSAASWSMLFRPIAPAGDEMSDLTSDKASTSSARESFGAPSVPFGATAASQAMSRLKNPFKQLGDKLKKGKRKATSSSTSKQVSRPVAADDDSTSQNGAGGGGFSTGTLKPASVEAPADILRKYEQRSSNSGSSSNQAGPSTMSTPIGTAASNAASPVKAPQTDSKAECSSRNSTAPMQSTYCEQMLMAKMRHVLTHTSNPDCGMLACLQRATSQGAVSDRAVAREALRGYKQSVSNGSSEQLVANLLSETDAWPNYYTHLLSSLMNAVSMRSRATSLTESFRTQNIGLLRCLATRLAAILLMGDAERRLVDDTSNRFRAAQMDERADVVLAMTERFTTSINQWLASWATPATSVYQHTPSAIADLRHMTLYQIERVFFARNYTAGLFSVPSFVICQETDDRFSHHVARLSVVLTADHPALSLPHPLQRDVPWPAVQFHLRQMGAARHPLDKAACLCDAIASLSRLLSLALQGGHVSSDHQLPALILVLVRANAPHLLSTRTYIQTFIGMADIQSIVIQSSSPTGDVPLHWPWRHSPEVMRFAFAQFSTAVAAIQQLIQQLVS